MSAIDKTGGTNWESLGLSSSSATTQKTSLQQDQFLTLMLAQIKNQSPLKPMEDGEFLTQMAQFSTATGIKDLKTSFSDFANSMQSNQALQASSIVGRTALVPTSSAPHIGSGVRGAVDLTQGTQRLHVAVYDSAGQLVRNIDLGAQDAGMVHFEWDGRDLRGDPVPVGMYTLKAEAVAGKKAEAMNTFVNALVESVTINQSGQGLTLNLGGIGSRNLSDIKEIS